MRGKITRALRNAMRSTINYHKSMVFYMQTLKAFLLVVLIVTVFLIVFLHGWNSKIVVFYSLIAIYDLFEYLDEMFVYAVSLRTGLASMEKIDRFIKEKKATVERIGLEYPERQEKKIKSKENTDAYAVFIKNLALRYHPRGELVIKNINVSLKRGHKIAIVGRTGSGKSTFVQALFRLVEPDPQSIYFIEGKDALSMSLKKLRAHFSCVPQFPFVF